MATFVKALRSEEAKFFDTHPLANHVLNVIARRARRTPCERTGLQIGECFIGHKGLGLSEQQYRTVKKNLQKWNLVEFKKAGRLTDQGTVAKLLNSSVYDINEEEPNGRPTEDQRKTNGRVTEDQRQTKNVIMEEGKNDKKKKVKPDVDFSVFDLSESDLAEVKRIRIKNKGGAIASQRVANGLSKEIKLALASGVSMDDLLTEWETAGWKSFKCEWLINRIGGNNGPYQQSAKQSSAAIDDNDTAWFDEYERRQQTGNSLAGQQAFSGAKGNPHGMEAGVTIEGSSERVEDPMDNGLFGEEYHRHGNNR